MPSESQTLSGGGGGGRFDSRYRFLVVSLKKCLSGDNYRRPSQLLLTRIVAFCGYFLMVVFVVEQSSCFCKCYVQFKQRNMAAKGLNSFNKTLISYS